MGFGAVLAQIDGHDANRLRGEPPLAVGKKCICHQLIAMGGIPANIQVWLFFAFAAAFAIKVPMFPLHSWLPDAHVQAPTAG